jgi:hypothetical protein
MLWVYSVLCIFLIVFIIGSVQHALVKIPSSIDDVFYYNTALFNEDDRLRSFVF